MDDSLPSIDFKFVESYLKDKFSRPFARRLKYLYLGLSHSEDTFVLSSTEDEDFVYCDAKQATGLVKIKNEEHLHKINQWFAWCKIDRTWPYLFYFNDVLSLLNKVPWKNPEITIERKIGGAVMLTVPGHDTILMARPVDTHFTLTKLQVYVDKYTKVFFTDEVAHHDVQQPESVKGSSVSILAISSLDLYNARLLDVACEDIKLVLLSGLDVLVPKSLSIVDNEHSSGIRLWADNGQRCVNYGGFYTDAEISLCTSRDNIFIFPKVKKEP